MLSGKFKTRPDAEEVIVEVTEDVSLPVCVSAKTFELERTLGERVKELFIILLKPIL